MSVSEWGGDSGARVSGADVDASGSAAVDPEQSALESGHDDSGDLSGREEAAFALAQVLDPDAFKSRTLPLREAAEVLHRQQVAMSVSLDAIDAGYRLVSEDDTTVDRVARAMWRWDISDVPVSDTDANWAIASANGSYQSKARAAVRALREATTGLPVDEASEEIPAAQAAATGGRALREADE